MDWLRELLMDVGQWTDDASFGRGAITAVGAIVAILFGGWRLLQRRPKTRTLVTIDCEQGERVVVQVGEVATKLPQSNDGSVTMNVPPNTTSICMKP